MAVAFDAEAHGSTTAAGTSIPNFTLTIGGAVTNGAVAVALAMGANSATGITVTIGGSAASLVSGTDSGTGQSVRTLIYRLATGSSTGAKTVSISWTGSMNACACAISASGVDQTTPLQNGIQETDSFNSTTTPNITITSASGNMTMDCITLASAAAPTSPTKTSRAAFVGADFLASLGVSTANGAATVNHQWTTAINEIDTQSGVDFKAATTAAQTPSVSDTATLAEAQTMQMSFYTGTINDAPTVTDNQTMHMPISLRMEKLT